MPKTKPRSKTKSVVQPLPPAPPSLQFEVLGEPWTLVFTDPETMSKLSGRDPAEGIVTLGTTLYQKKLILLLNSEMSTARGVLETAFHEIFHAHAEFSCAMPPARQGMLCMELAAEVASRFALFVMRHGEEICDFIDENLVAPPTESVVE